MLSRIISSALLLLSGPGVQVVVNAKGPPEISDIQFGAWHTMGFGIGEENNRDKEGYAVATSALGDIVAVGAPLYTAPGGKELAGRVRVFRFSEDEEEWVQIGGDIIGHAGDHAGSSVALSVSGDFLAVGAPKATETIEDSNVIKRETGCVRVYERETDKNGNEFYLYMPNEICGEESFDEFGYAVKIHDEYDTNGGSDALDMLQVAIGAPGAKNSQRSVVGKAYFYQYVRNGGQRGWFNKSENTSGDNFIAQGTPGSRFGNSIAMSIDDEIVIVGAPFEDYQNVKHSGRVYLFNRSTAPGTNTKTFSRINGIKMYGMQEGEECGTSVSITLRGEFVAYGCPGANTGEQFNVGKTEVKKLIYVSSAELGDSWTSELVDTPIYGTGEGDRAGTSIDLGQGTEIENLFLGVGSPGSSPTLSKPKAGEVRVFHRRKTLENGGWMSANLDIDGFETNDEFGTSVAMGYDGRRVVVGAPGKTGYAMNFQLHYTEAPSLAPTPFPTPEPTRPNKKKPSQPTGKGGGNVNTGSGQYGDPNGMSPLLLMVIVIILIPGIIFFMFKGVVYWRARRRFDARFGTVGSNDDGAVNSNAGMPSDLELTPAVNNNQSGNGEVRDII
jgi:hypothetical protein